MTINAIALNAIKADSSLKKQRNMSFGTTSHKSNEYEKTNAGFKSGLFAGGVIGAYDIYTDIKAGNFNGLSKYKIAKKIVKISLGLLAAGAVIGGIEDFIVNKIRKNKADKAS